MKLDEQVEAETGGLSNLIISFAVKIFVTPDLLLLFDDVLLIVE
jgi:hypothetical protein